MIDLIKYATSQGLGTFLGVTILVGIICSAIVHVVQAIACKCKSYFPKKDPWL